jgi:hypothetical protein
MGTHGSFGYKIGRKVRLMRVHCDADLLWQILVREIYVLMKHYGTIEALRQAFEGLVEAKNKPKPKPTVIEKLKPFTDLKVSHQNTSDWVCLTRYCQHSFINVLESGYFLNNGNEDDSFVFILDFNTSSAVFYGTDWGKKRSQYEKATIEEIMEFEEMPSKSYTEIVSEMSARFEKYNDSFEKVNQEIEKINNIIKKAQELGGDQNVISKAKELLSDMEWEKRKLEIEYRFFYHRLDALNLIDHDS